MPKRHELESKLQKQIQNYLESIGAYKFKVHR